MGEVDEILISSDHVQMMSLDLKGLPIKCKEPHSPLVGRLQNAGITIETARV